MLPPRDDETRREEPQPESPIEEVLWQGLRRRQSELPQFVLQHVPPEARLAAFLVDSPGRARSIEFPGIDLRPLGPA